MARGVVGCEAMRFGVLGTGMVGQAIAGKLVAVGHEVKMGSREAGNEKAVAWASEAGEGASEGSFADAAGFGEVVVNATAGAHSLEALEAAGAENLAGKVLIDVANALDFSQGMPPTLTVCNDDSLGEQIQRAFPDARVVKALNTINASVMVAPGSLGETTNAVRLRGRRGRQGSGHGAARELRLGRGDSHGSGRHLGGAGDGDVPAALAADDGRLGTAQFNIADRRGKRLGLRRRRGRRVGRRGGGTGIHGRLKNGCPQGLGGSNPSPAKSARLKRVARFGGVAGSSPAPGTGRPERRTGA